MTRETFKYLRERLSKVKSQRLQKIWGNNGFVPVEVRQARRILKRYDRKLDGQKDRVRKRIEAAASAVTERIILNDVPGALKALKRFEKARFML